MKKILLLFLVIITVSCQEDPEPEQLTARVIVAQRAHGQSMWNAQLVTYGDEITETFFNSHRGFWEDYNAPIEPNQPFALIMETIDWDGRLDIMMKISEKDVKVVTVLDSLELKEIYIHPNGNPSAAQDMANSITFPANILILDN